MKMVDLFALSLGYCKTGLKRLVIPMLMVCIGVVGLCFAGAAHIAVWEDKREPVMLNLTSGDKADVGEMAYAEMRV